MDHKELLRIIGSRLKELRTARGWTQVEVAARARIGRDFLGRAERGRGDGEPSLFVLHKLAGVFEVPPSYLLTPPGEKQSPILGEIQALLTPRPDQELSWFRELIKFHLAQRQHAIAPGPSPVRPRRTKKKR